MRYLKELLGSGTAFIVTTALLQFLAILLLAWLLKWFLKTAGRRLAAKTTATFDDKILEILIDRMTWIAVVLGVYLAIGQVKNVIGKANETALRFIAYTEGIIFVCFVIVLTIILIRISDTIIRHTIERRTEAQFHEGILPLVNRIVSIIITLIALIITLNYFRQDVSSLVVSLGVGSLAIALAAQDTIANMIAGFVIMMDKPFRPGDRIQLASGETGDVYEIGIRSTKVLDFDNNVIVMPNAELTKGKIVNYSYPEMVIRVMVQVGVAYGTDIDQARQIMVKLARLHPHVMSEPAPEVFVMDLADSAILLRLVGRSDDFRQKFLTETALREEIYNSFVKEGIEIPFPQRVVHLQQASNAKPQASQKRKTTRRQGL
ncbi:MAG: mechanosensitive ion channel domain-containing protein [Bacteroidota bacterium]